MAQVTLQVVVNDQALDALTKKVDALDHRKINIDISGIQKNIQGAADATAKLDTNLEEADKGMQSLGETGSRVLPDLTNEQKEHTEEIKKGTEAVKQQGFFYKILGTSLSSFIARSAAYRTIAAGLHAITNGFKEALAAMKAVDDELVTVRKVTGFSDEQIESIKNQAYSTASKYGAEAADYLSAVAAFSRAGYKELATQLAELSLKTQIVGDTTQDVANQFLISVDAAYKYKGSVEELSKVLDGANEIDNKYATTIEKIAEGMGIVAPVAAQMRVGVDELTAALGTITAVTQRSGSESARALRALFLNIVGDTKTEIEEGVTWTTGEIAGLQDVIKKYAKDAYLAAQATGSIIDPMRAIEGLSKSIKDGVLTEAELMEMVSDIGGKLRTSQLLALINNWDMYESMLKDYKNAYGSADKEIENAMDSWSRKSAVLKNTWTEFLQKTISTEKIKNILDFLSSFIRNTDSLTGVLVRLGIVLVSLNLSKIVTAIKSINIALTSTTGIIGAISIAATVIWSIISHISARADEEAEEKKRALEEAKREQREAERKALEESRNSIARNKERIAGLDELYESYKKINSARYTEEERATMLAEWENKLVEAYGVEKSAIDEVNDGLKTRLELLEEVRKEDVARSYVQGLDAYLNAVGILSSSYHFSDTGSAEGSIVLSENATSSDDRQSWKTGQTGILVDAFTKVLGLSLTEKTTGGGLYDYDSIYKYTSPDTESYIKTIRNSDLASDRSFDLNFVGTYAEYIDVLTQAGELISQQGAKRGYLEEGEKSALSWINDELDHAKTSLSEAKATAEEFLPIFAEYNLNKLGIDIKNLKTDHDYADAILALNKAMQEGNITGEEATQITDWLLDRMESLTGATNDSTDSIYKHNSALGENERALDKNATAAERAAAAKKDAEAAARKLIPALFDEANKLTDAGKAALYADSNLASMVKSELEAELAAKQANYSNLTAQIATVGGMAAYARAELEAMGQLSGNPVLDALAVAAASAKLAAQKVLIKAEIQALMSQIAQVGVYVPSTGSGSGHSGSSGSGHSGSSYSTSTEDQKLKSLQERVSLLKSELSLMQTRGDSEEDLVAKMKQIQEALKAEEAYLRSINGSQIDINKLQEEWWSYQNKIQSSAEKTQEAEEATAKAIQDAVDAQIALNNAMKERNVHVFNSATGRWEWQADPSAVQSARENLINAAQNLPDGIRENFVREYGITLPGAQSVSNINGTNNYGNTYNFGSFTLTEDQARSMSVYELARLSQTLGVYGNSV